MSTLQTGYAALLDVMGFTALVYSEDHAQRIEGYLNLLRQILDKRPLIEYLVFSDSIIITTTDDTEEAFKAILERCSRLFGALLENGIPVRGAISHGSYVSEKTDSGRFVAGRAVIDAYDFETKQNWVGIMLAPAVVRKNSGLKNLCKLPEPSSLTSLADAERRIRDWAAYAQYYAGIPFHDGTYEGFSIVPTNASPTPPIMRDELYKNIERLERLKSLAPSPETQAKYNRTINWLRGVHANWHSVASRYDQLAQEEQRRARA
jgi:hypothetical protein